MYLKYTINRKKKIEVKESENLVKDYTELICLLIYENAKEMINLDFEQ